MPFYIREAGERDFTVSKKSHLISPVNWQTKKSHCHEDLSQTNVPSKDLKQVLASTTLWTLSFWFLSLLLIFFPSPPCCIPRSSLSKVAVVAVVQHLSTRMIIPWVKIFITSIRLQGEKEQAWTWFQNKLHKVWEKSQSLRGHVVQDEESKEEEEEENQWFEKKKYSQ